MSHTVTVAGIWHSLVLNHLLGFFCALAYLVASPKLLRAEEPPLVSAAAQREFFETRIRPILAERCYSCHSGQADKIQAGLRVDHRDWLLKGGDSGPAIVLSPSSDSPLLQAVRHETVVMPPDGKLSESQIGDLSQWIASGAWWPPEEQAATVEAKEPPKPDWRARKAQHWSWQPLRRIEPPTVADNSWSNHPVDRFVLQRLRTHELTPGPEASRRALIRRLYFDLLGIPPTPAAIERFVQDTRADSYERLVDGLLAAPQFGEKWARHWLDLVRYAETCGHEFDYPLPHAYQYRDYVIRAWNGDVPYDQWIREHWAGDLLTNPRENETEGFNESIIATGFWFLGEANHAPTDVLSDEADRIDSQVLVWGKAFLGLTIACARCHDHKFDPIEMSDYYGLVSYLQSSRRQDAGLDPGHRIARNADRLRTLADQGHAAFAHEIAKTASQPSRWQAYLLAASDVNAGLSSIEASTSNGQLEKAMLEKWVAALQGVPRDLVDHPFHVWRQLGEGPDAQFSAQLTSLRDSLQKLQIASAEVRSMPIPEWGSTGREGWFVTGEAWRFSPQSRLLLDSPAAPLRISRPGTWDSGISTGRLRGVLRSPTFTLEHPRIHHWIRGSQVQIRLIVDGYVMDLHSPLLFADNTLESVDTQGEWRWVTQQQDLDHYLGHRAHLEYIDHGEGDFAVGGAIQSDGPAPPSPPARTPQGWLVENSSEPPLTRTRLAELYGGWIDSAIRSVSDGSADAETTRLVEWMVRSSLLPDGAEAGRMVRQEAQQIASETPEPVWVMAMTDGTPEDIAVQIRGNPHNGGSLAPRRLLVAMAGEAQPVSSHGSGRVELAERFLAADNPWPRRVMANRLWHLLLGRGIAPSVDDLGAMGQPPTDPELLDWLATELERRDWSMKGYLRMLVTSRTYRLGSQISDVVAEERDPTNQWWHRGEPRRLSAEALRDTMLTLSGRLDSQMLGPSVPVYLNEFVTGRGAPPNGPLDGGGRRSIYLRIQRNFLSPMMQTFDMPSPSTATGRRTQSNVPAQSLILLNNPFVWECAQRWSEQLARDYPRLDDQILHAAYQAWGRKPDERELNSLRAFMQAQASDYGCDVNDVRVRTDMCHILLNTKEFLFVF